MKLQTADSSADLQNMCTGMTATGPMEEAIGVDEVAAGSPCLSFQ